MAENGGGRRVIEVHEGILGPAKPRLRTVQPKTLGNFPSLPPAYLEVVKKLSSPLLMGPPICDELVAFVQHLFTEEEASVVRHLGTLRGHDGRRDRPGRASPAGTDRADPPSAVVGEAGDRLPAARKGQRSTA